MTNPNLKTRNSEKLGDAERMMMLGRIKEQGEKTGPLNRKIYSRLARQFAHTKGYSEEILRSIYKVATEPKMASDRYYQDFLKAFANGTFSRESDLIQMLLKSLGRMQSDKAGPRERKTTQEILRHIGDSRGAIGERTEKNLSKQIKEAREKDEKATASEGKSAVVIAETAQTSSRATDIVRDKEKIYPLKLGKWTVENPPEGLMEELHKAYDEQYKLAKSSEKITDKKELAEIDRQMDALARKTEPLKEAYCNYLSRALGQFRAQKQFAEEMGVSDLNNLEGLTFLNPETVRSDRKKEQLKIEEISFDTEGIDPDSPGKFVVRFTDEKGHKGKEAGVPFLLNHAVALEGYEEISSPEIFDEKFGQEMEYKNIESSVGETFEAETIGFKDGKESYKKETFVISAVERISGKWVVKLDRKVIKIPKWKMPSSVQTSLYFDRKEQEFSLGEFGAFLKREGYKRVVGDEELQEVADKSAQANARECRKLIEGASPEEKARFEAVGGEEVDKFRIPTIGEKQKVIFVEDGVTRTGFLTMSKSGEGNETTFELETAAAGSLAAGAKGKARVKRIPMEKRHLMTLANKGDIQNAHETHRPAHEEGLVKDDFEKMSAAETISSKPDSHEHGESADGKKKEDGEAGKVYEEALDYSQVHKVGGMGKVERGFLKTMWAHTHFLSVSDLWHMGKTMWEYHLRRFERRQKERYSMVGKDLPYFAPEMQRMKQHAEIEQVNQFKESFEDFGVYEIQERLRQTHNQDELKAAFTVLAEKGQLRWDDIETWKNLNKFVEPDKAVPIPSNGDPYTTVSEKDKRTGFSFLKDAIDSLWGEGTYNEWFAKNKTTYQQNSKGYYEKGKELEGIDGGHGRRLAELLRAHKEGRYVDPHEYEGLIIHSIDAGKGTMQAKIYYMIEGVAAENHEGRTIMPFDRIAHINSEMLNQFPILEYLCAKATRTGQPKDKGGTRFTIDDYKRWVGWFDAGNHMNFEPTKEVDNFMWRYVIPSDDTQNRINKALRSAEKLDHDDMFAYLPPATTQIITDACGATTGAKKFLTVEGYANAFPGFSQYMRSLGENDNRKKLIDAVKSWVRFEGIMTGRFDKQKGSDVMQRMDKETLNQGTIVTPDIAPKVFMDQLNETMQAVVEAYDDKDLTNTYALLREETGDIFSNPDQMDQQKKINFAFKEFDGVFDRVARRDAGKKLKDIVVAANLTGMTFLPSEEKDRRKAQRGNLLELDYETESHMPFSGGHGGGASLGI